AGLRRGDQVAAGERERNGVLLDRGGGGVAVIGDPAQKHGGQGETIESHVNPCWRGASRARGARSNDAVSPTGPGRQVGQFKLGGKLQSAANLAAGSYGTAAAMTAELYGFAPRMPQEI